jgi:excinuclease ABC subunit A
MELPAGTAFSILAPVIRGQKGEHKDLFAELGRAGFVRARVNGQVVSLSDDLALERNVKHNIEVVIDRLKAGPSVRARVADAIELALKHGDGTAIIAPEGQPDILLSSQYACAPCGLGFEPPSPQLFSFNSPQGMCPDCDGARHQAHVRPRSADPRPLALGGRGGARPDRDPEGAGEVAEAPH